MNWRMTRRKFISDLGSVLVVLPLPRLLRPRPFETDAKSLAPNGEFLLWFAEPAKQWGDALPVVNGRLGAMVFGGYRNERLALNEDTLWSGAPRDWNNPSAKEHLPVVRKLVLELQNYHEADLECRKMQGPYNQSYEPLADLAIAFTHGDQVNGYRRSLDLDSGIAKVAYEANGINYSREVFSSAPAQLLVVRLMCSKPGNLNCEVRLTSQLRYASEAASSGEIVLRGKAPNESIPQYLRDKNPIRYDDAYESRSATTLPISLQQGRKDVRRANQNDKQVRHCSALRSCQFSSMGRE